MSIPGATGPDGKGVRQACVSSSCAIGRDAIHDDSVIVQSTRRVALAVNDLLSTDLVAVIVCWKGKNLDRLNIIIYTNRQPLFWILEH